MAHLRSRDHLPIFWTSLQRSRDASLSSTLREYNPNPEQQSSSSSSEASTVLKVAFQVGQDVLQDNPHFHQHTETTHAELFYDLFFVANLNVSTGVLEVNDPKTLAQHVGFFCTLWFTWYQVSLYDVRLSMDSVIERVAKALQFGVIIGFATVAPNFDVGNDMQDEEHDPVWTLKELSLIIMASQLVLVYQYLQSLWFTRAFARTGVPMARLAATPKHLYITWYSIAIFETALATAISSFRRVVGFKGTYLVQRMCLLTLIILGEGVIGLAGECQAIVTSQVFEFTASTVGDIVSAVLVLYFLFRIYFDWLPQGHFGAIGQQIWAFLYFPLHLFMVLAVEGLAQALVWRAAVSKIDSIAEEISRFSTSPGTSMGEIIEVMNATARSMFKAGYESPRGLESIESPTNAQSSVERGLARLANAVTSDTVDLGSTLVFDTLQAVVFQIAGFEPPKSEAPAVDAQEYGSTGLAIVLNAVLGILSKKDQVALHWSRWAINTLIGIGLCTITLILYTAHHTSSK